MKNKEKKNKKIPTKQQRKQWGKEGQKKAGFLIKNDDKAFELYFEHRGLATVARELGVSKNAIEKHSHKMDWPARLEKRIKIAQDKADKLVGEKIGRHNAQTVQLSRALKSVVGGLVKQGHMKKENGEVIITLTTKEAKDLSETLTNSSKLERLVLGETTEKTETTDATWKDFITYLATGKK